MELNVKQSGIERRVLIPSYFKNRAGKVNKRVTERYLRHDISCGLICCENCVRYGKNTLVKSINGNCNLSVNQDHAIIVDTQSFIRFYDLFDSDLFHNVIITQTVWEYIKSKSITAYKKINSLCYEERSPRFFVFMSELHHETFVAPMKGLSEDERQEKVLSSCGLYMLKHWQKHNVLPVILCADENTVARVQKDYPNTKTIKEYVIGMKDKRKQELINMMAAYEHNPKEHVENIFAEHLSHDEIITGIARGVIKKGTFCTSRENYLEATVMIDQETMTSWFIQGINCNRAVNGDTVAVQLLPESEWSAPEKTIRLRDVEEITLTADDDTDSYNEPIAKRKKVSVVPTAKVVGIIKRNWRSYCGILIPSTLKGARRHLFCPAERLIPRIRIETEQAEILAKQRIVVCIDQWPRDSKYPLGHYVRTLGNLGDKEAEYEVLLLEHDVPHAPFSDAVIDCLPAKDWKPALEFPRVDLRNLTICSVDPLGCTDIDDALHCKPLHNGLIEVGVHIADVSHFVRPGTAMDEEACNRGTTVYLCDRRIDMLPAMLSSNLCSLRGNEERYAFSVIWTMTNDAEIVHTKFHKSLICSKAALTYEEAQELIDSDSSSTDEITLGLRGLIKLAKLLRERRTANGALTLASSEVRFDMDWETRTPKAVMEKKHLDTHWMVEEFMLLANISVAEKILAEYPDCALLRRHPAPNEPSYKPLIELSIIIHCLLLLHQFLILSNFFTGALHSFFLVVFLDWCRKRIGDHNVPWGPRSILLPKWIRS